MDKIDFFAYLALTTSDDGTISEPEKARLRESAKRLGLSKADIEEAFRRIGDRQRPLPDPASPAEAEKIFAEMIPLMFADENPTEVEFLVLLSEKWKVDPRIVAQILARGVIDHVESDSRK